MPITIQPATLKYKNNEGTYQSVDCLKGEDGASIDVQVNGTSIVSSGVANIPLASDSAFGVVKIGSGLNVYNNVLVVNPANSTQVKGGTAETRPIAPVNQHESVFYGLAKAAGDSTQASSSNAVGTYTDGAKTAIRTMIGAGTGNGTVTDIQVNSTSVVSNGVANIPLAGYSTYGVYRSANSDEVKAGASSQRAISPAKQDASTFYGLAKAAGQDMSSSSNAVGTYTDAAKTAIQTMIGAAPTASPVFTGSVSLGRKANTTVGENSFAFGYNTEASGTGSIAEGYQTKANGLYARAEGYETIASGSMAHAEGDTTTANLNAMHAEGAYNVVPSTYPVWAANTHYYVGDKVIYNGWGRVCKTENTDAQFASSKWNFAASTGPVAHVIGNGDDSTPSNAQMIDWDGNEYLKGNIYVGCNADSSGGTRLPHDVQVNGTSVVSSGVANVPLASTSDVGVVKTQGGRGIAVNSSGLIYIDSANETQVKGGSQGYNPIVPGNQHIAAFYGLARAAGDASQASSSNAVGTYTAAAKTAIQGMLGISTGATLIGQVTGTTPSITAQPNIRYICGEVSTLSITPPDVGSCEVIFESGSTATVLTVPNTVIFPAWFDATSLDTNTIYDIIITDSRFGAVMTWPNS